jgi:predicted GNAT superfamily acetyltransferase
VARQDFQCADVVFDEDRIRAFCLSRLSFIVGKHVRLVCEVNSNPPNPASDAFHAALGFAEVGSASILDDSKIVRYLQRGL